MLYVFKNTNILSIFCKKEIILITWFKFINY
jgi:hypothetical protein